MKKLTKKDVIRLIAIVIFIAVMITATILLFPVFKNIGTEQGREAMRQKLSDRGISGILLFLGLQIVQVFIAFIPGEPVEIIGGVLYGGFWGMLLCLVGLLIGTILVYYMVKKLGKPLVNVFVSDEQLQRFKFLQSESKLETVIFILFFIPGTPKDALTYFVPLTKIKPAKFFMISTFARIPSVISSTIAGSLMGEGEWVLMIGVFVVTGLIGILGIYLNKKFMERKQARNITAHNGEENK